MRLKYTFASCFGLKPNSNGLKPENPRAIVAVTDDIIEPEKVSERRLRMVWGSFYIPKKDRASHRGEDVDAGVYARALMRASAGAAARSVGPRAAIEEAFEAARGVREGSSTALVAAHGGGVLTAAGIGDSGFAVFRGKKRAGPVVVAARSEAQQHGFNCPYQLGNGEGYDHPGCAAEWRVAVEEGDVVVLATDGVWDNVYLSEIGRVVGASGPDIRPKRLAKMIAGLAYRNSMDEDWESPFAREASLAGEPRMGGKKDDITVVVGVIVNV